jgi:MFS family permease
MHVATLRFMMQLDDSQRVARRRSGFLRNLREGIALARSNRVALLAISMSLVFNLFGFPGMSMIPVVGDQQLHLSAAMVGFLTAAEGIGATLGSVLIVRYGHRIRYHGRFFAIGCITFILMMAVFSMAPNAALAWLALLVSGFGVAGFASMQATLVLIGAPESARSRLMGLLTISIGSGPIGFLLLGWTAERLGAATALQLMVIEGLVAWMIVTWRMRDVITQPTPGDR